jgi:hypothetical protein
VPDTRDGWVSLLAGLGSGGAHDVELVSREHVDGSEAGVVERVDLGVRVDAAQVAAYVSGELVGPGVVQVFAEGDDVQAGDEASA